MARTTLSPSVIAVDWRAVAGVGAGLDACGGWLQPAAAVANRARVRRTLGGKHFSMRSPFLNKLAMVEQIEFRSLAREGSVDGE
jgi:hypothetical protein